MSCPASLSRSRTALSAASAFGGCDSVREFNHGGEVGRRGGVVGKRHRRDEQVLEARFGRGLDLLDIDDRGRDLGPLGGTHKHTNGAGAAGITDGPDTLDRAVRDKPEDKG
ncbi:MAG: hypothetical protein ACI9C1_001457, partial [Candidatus Aldehydirespiratoraceae bacterium]